MMAARAITTIRGLDIASLVLTMIDVHASEASKTVYSRMMAARAITTIRGLDIASLVLTMIDVHASEASKTVYSI